MVCHSAESRWEAWGNGGSGTFWVRLKQGGRLSPVLLVGLELPDYTANWGAERHSALKCELGVPGLRGRPACSSNGGHEQAAGQRQRHDLRQVQGGELLLCGV